MSAERRFRAFPGPGQPRASSAPAGMILASGVTIDPEGRSQLMALVQEWDGGLHLYGRRFYRLTEVTLGQWAVPHLLNAIDVALQRRIAITGIATDGSVFHSTQTVPSRCGYFIPMLDQPNQFVPLYLSAADEGKTWIRGYHEANSAAVQAIARRA